MFSKHHPWNVHMFLAFSCEQLCSDLSWQMKSLLSLNWHVLKVSMVKFQASTWDQCHHLLINLSCKSASKPLNALSARSAVCFLQPISQLSTKSSGRHYDCASYTVCTCFGCAPTQHVHSKHSRDVAEAPTSEVDLLQNLRSYKKWIPLTSNFWAINQRT